MPGGPSPVIELMDPRHHVFGDDRTNETIPRFRLTDSLATAAEPNPNGRARAAYQGPGPARRPEDEPQHPNEPVGSLHGRRALTLLLALWDGGAHSGTSLSRGNETGSSTGARWARWWSPGSRCSYPIARSPHRTIGLGISRLGSGLEVVHNGVDHRASVTRESVEDPRRAPGEPWEADVPHAGRRSGAAVVLRTTVRTYERKMDPRQVSGESCAPDHRVHAS